MQDVLQVGTTCLTDSINFTVNQTGHRKYSVSESYSELYKHKGTIVIFTAHVPVFFWSSRYNFRDIELKFCNLS